MALNSWVGRAALATQVTTLTVGGAPAAGQTYVVTINGRAVTHTAAGGETTAALAAALAATLGASPIAEFAEVYWVALGAVVTAGGEPGRPYVFAAGGTGTLTLATPVAANGPNFWGNPANWSLGVAPALGDDVYVSGGPAILYDLAAVAAVLASLTFGPDFVNEVGLPATVGGSSGGAPEYRPRRLAVKATVVRVESPSRAIRLDLGATATTVTVDSGDGSLDLVAVNAANTLRVDGGRVDVAAAVGEAATLATATVGEGGEVLLGAGVTLDTLSQLGGAVTLRCAVTTVVKLGGSLVRRGSGAIATLRNRGGSVTDHGTGTIAALFNGDSYARAGSSPLAVTDATLYVGSVTSDPSGVVAWTNPVQFFECHPAGPMSAPGPSPAHFVTAPHKRLAVSNIP